MDLLVLGDSPIYVGPGGDLVTDDRLAQLHLPARAKLYQWLRGGAGYDDVDQDLFRALGAEKVPYLNEAGGYWIAEARPEAAHHAAARTVPATRPWLVMLADGADSPMRHLGIPAERVVGESSEELDVPSEAACLG